MLRSVVEQIEARLKNLTGEGRVSLARNVSLALVTGVDQALEGALVRRGQLIVLPAHARQPLQALELAPRWASVDE
jgi:hypothetical protein